MPYTLYSNLIKDSGTDIRYNEIGQVVGARIDRSYFVGDIDDAGSEVINAGVAYIQTIVAAGSAHPSLAIAKATGYRGIPLNSSNAVEVVVTFSFNWTAAPKTYTVEITSGLKGEVFNGEYDASNNIKPLMVSYNIDWTNPETNNTAPVGSTSILYPATVSVMRPMSNIVITKSVSQTVATNLEDAIGLYVGGVNKTVFRGKAVRSLLCSGITTSEDRNSGKFIGRIEFTHRPETWDEYARVTTTQFGTPSNVWLASTAPVYLANGIRKTQSYPAVNFAPLLNILDA